MPRVGEFGIFVSGIILLAGEIVTSPKQSDSSHVIFVFTCDIAFVQIDG